MLSRTAFRGGTPAPRVAAAARARAPSGPCRRCAGRCTGLCAPAHRDPGNGAGPSGRGGSRPGWLGAGSCCPVLRDLPVTGSPRASGAYCEDGEAARAAPHRSHLWTVVVARHSGFDFLRAQEDSLQLFRLETFLVECKPLHLTFSALSCTFEWQAGRNDSFQSDISCKGSTVRCSL